MNQKQRLIRRLFAISHPGWNIPETTHGLDELTARILTAVGPETTEYVINDPDDKGICTALVLADHLSEMTLRAPHGRFSSVKALKDDGLPVGVTIIEVIDAQDNVQFETRFTVTTPRPQNTIN